MRNKILILSIFVTVCVSGAAVAQTMQGPHVMASPSPSPAQKWTCVMHPEVVLDHPGNCPKCGMTLVPMKPERKRLTSNAQRSTSNAEQVGAIDHNRPDHEHAEAMTHNANGMSMPKSEHGYDHEHPPSVAAATSGAAGEMHMKMQSSVNIADPMGRESSGTAWVPDSTPMYGYMKMLGDDMLMLHGGIFPRYTNASTRRGDDRIDAPNWFMAMYSSRLAGFGDSAQLGFRAMMSLDPLTEQGRGYPLLFQTGETWHGKALHDRQHPHDLFDELSVTYSQKINVDLSSYVYFGYPGEPALGPPTFMHRLSAMDNPDAPLGHHWEDSTHVTFGVATAGLQYRNLKVEGSIFTGREPDEHRYDFDRPEFDSYSGRISWNPIANLALQVSHAYIRSPEALDPNVNRHRTTASAIYNLPLGHDTNWSNSFVWGRNNDAGEKTNAFLLETNFQRGSDTIYARWERVEKSGHELVLDPVDEARIFPVSGYTIGYVRDLRHGDKIDIGLGAQFTLNDFPDRLERYYGDGLGYSFEIFARIRPSLHGDHMEGAAPSAPK